jgi:hypothetical protein
MLTGDGMVLTDTFQCLVVARDIPLILFRCQRMVDGSNHYRIISFDPIDSGEETAAYRIMLQR